MDTSLKDKIQDIEIKIEVLQDIIGELEQGIDIERLAIRGKSVTLSNGNKYQISKQTSNVFVIGMTPPEGETTEFIEIDIQSSLGKSPKPWIFEEIYPDNDKFKEYLARYKGVRDYYQKRLSTIWKDSAAIWSYWDFFYFSFITQTTLGYGDILPKSSQVRKWVIAQVFLGLSILVLLINFVILLFQA